MKLASFLSFGPGGRAQSDPDTAIVDDDMVLPGSERVELRLHRGAHPRVGELVLDRAGHPPDPAAEEEGAGGAMFPTGNVVDTLEVPGVGSFQATMINAGIPTIFLNADEIGYTGTELQEAINGDAAALAKFEKIRVAGALRMDPDLVRRQGVGGLDNE